MVTSAAFQTLAGQARRLYTEELANGLAGLVQEACENARALLDIPTEHASAMRRRDLVSSLLKLAPAWHRGMVGGLRNALLYGVSASRIGEFTAPATLNTMSLVDDDIIELEIATSRLALAIMDRASWEFSDLRARVAHLEQRAELDPHDLLRAHVLARVVVDAWRGAGLSLTDWRELQRSLHDDFAHLAEEAYHETNRWLIERHVLPEVDLRPFVQRHRNTPIPGTSGMPALTLDSSLNLGSQFGPGDGLPSGYVPSRSGSGSGAGDGRWGFDA